jgi:hypothetical protein
MIDPIRDKLHDYYGITAKDRNIDAGMDILKDSNEPADEHYSAYELPDVIRAGKTKEANCRVYEANDGVFYLTVECAEPFPSDEAIISYLNHYTYQNEYDITADYQPLTPAKPLSGFRVYKLVPLTVDGQRRPLSEIYKLG